MGRRHRVFRAVTLTDDDPEDIIERYVAEGNALGDLDKYQCEEIENRLKTELNGTTFRLKGSKRRRINDQPSYVFELDTGDMETDARSTYYFMVVLDRDQRVIKPKIRKGDFRRGKTVSELDTYDPDDIDRQRSKQMVDQAIQSMKDDF